MIIKNISVQSDWKKLSYIIIDNILGYWKPRSTKISLLSKIWDLIKWSDYSNNLKNIQINTKPKVYCTIIPNIQFNNLHVGYNINSNKIL